MQNIQIFNYNETPIEFEVINGEVFANATLMCQAFDKRPINWLDLSSTKRYIEAVKARSVNLTLVESVQGGSNPRTRIHEKLILKLAQWLDIDFEVWCDEKLAELLRTGKTSINKDLPTNFLEALKLLVVKEEEKEVLQAQVKTLEHKTEYTEKVLKTTNTLLATEVCKEFGFKSANQLNKKLVEKGVIYKVRGHFVVAAKYAGKGYEKYSEYQYGSTFDGTLKMSRQMEWTQLGRAFLHSLFNKDLSYSKSCTYPAFQIHATN